MLRSDAKPVRKRSPISTALLQAVGAMEFVSAHRLPFTAGDIAKDMEMSDTAARRIVRTLELASWVEKVDEDLSPAHVPNGANPTQHYRALKRIRRI